MLFYFWLLLVVFFRLVDLVIKFFLDFFVLFCFYFWFGEDIFFCFIFKFSIKNYDRLNFGRLKDILFFILKKENSSSRRSRRF